MAEGEGAVNGSTKGCGGNMTSIRPFLTAVLAVVVMESGCGMSSKQSKGDIQPSMSHRVKNAVDDYLQGKAGQNVIEFKHSQDAGSPYVKYKLRHIGVYEFPEVDPMPPPVNIIITADGTVIYAADTKAIVKKVGLKPASAEEALAISIMLVEISGNYESIVNGQDTVSSYTQNTAFASLVPEDVRKYLQPPGARESGGGWEVVIYTFYSSVRPRVSGEIEVRKMTLLFTTGDFKMAREIVWSDRPGKLGL